MRVGKSQRGVPLSVAEGDQCRTRAVPESPTSANQEKILSPREVKPATTNTRTPGVPQHPRGIGKTLGQMGSPTAELAYALAQQRSYLWPDHPSSTLNKLGPG